MKVIDKSEIKDKKWCVGDVIAFKANKESMATYAIIIEKTSHDNLAPLVATVVLNGLWTGDWGYMKEKGWQEIRSYHPLHEIFMKLNLITLVTLGFFYTL